MSKIIKEPKKVKLTKKENELIKKIIGDLVDQGIRPLVLLGLATHCVGAVSYTTGGMDTDLLLDIVKYRVEDHLEKLRKDK